MRWQRVSAHFQSLRSRLTFWNTLVVLIAVVVALFGVREGLRFYLVEELDDVLDDEVRELILIIEETYPDKAQIHEAMRRKSEVHRIHGWHIRWLSEDRSETLWVSEANAPTKPLTQQLTSQEGRTVWVSDSHRSIERRVEASHIPPFYVRVGSMTEFIEHNVARMTQIMLPVGLAIFLLAPLGGYFLATRAIEPLQKIISTTEKLRPSRLEDRFTLRGVDDELDQLAFKINQFLDQIADHLNQHRAFLANAAHELRSPLTAIQSSVEVTMQQPRTREEYEDLLESISEQCHHLGQLVNQVLELAANDSGVVEVKKQPVRLDELARTACEMFQAVAEERGLQLELRNLSPAWVGGDPQQLRQLLTNLIDNAIKFTPSGGRISLKVESHLADRGVHLWVQDTGIGIGAEDLPRIFDRFFRADKSRQRGTLQRGSGLGLAICSSIVGGHHGTMTVDSEPGRGTVFHITLPAIDSPLTGK